MTIGILKKQLIIAKMYLQEWAIEIFVHSFISFCGGSISNRYCFPNLIYLIKSILRRILRSCFDFKSTIIVDIWKDMCLRCKNFLIILHFAYICRKMLSFQFPVDKCRCLFKMLVFWTSGIKIECCFAAGSSSL